MAEPGIPNAVPSANDGPRPDPKLSARIGAYTFDKPGASMPFSLRLAHDNGWTQAYALRVIDEYRRFVTLACIAEGEVTPSDEVDQVWHQHLAYSRMYWEDFCPKVLRRPLHHGPTEGGETANIRYEDNYRRTLALYRETFSEAPPPDIWPPPEVRFGASDYTRVNRAIFAIAPLQSVPFLGLSPRQDVPGSMLFLLYAVFFGLIASAAPWSAGILASLVLAAMAVLLFLLASGLVSFAVSASRSARGKEAFTQAQHGFDVTFAASDGVTALSHMRRRRLPAGGRGLRSSNNGGANAHMPVWLSCTASDNPSDSSGCGRSGCGRS